MVPPVAGEQPGQPRPRYPGRRSAPGDRRRRDRGTSDGAGSGRRFPAVFGGASPVPCQHSARARAAIGRLPTDRRIPLSHPCLLPHRRLWSTARSGTVRPPYPNQTGAAVPPTPPNRQEPDDDAPRSHDLGERQWAKWHPVRGPPPRPGHGPGGRPCGGAPRMGGRRGGPRLVPGGADHEGFALRRPDRGSEGMGRADRRALRHATRRWAACSG